MSDFVFADYEGISEPFPGLDDATKQVLETIKQKLTSFSLFADEQEIYFAVIGLVLNIFHFIVLVQKSMMTSSTNMILVGIAIADLVFLTAVVLSYLISQPWRYSDVCYTPASYISTYTLHITSSVRNAARRSSCWLAISMALTRVVIMNNMQNPKSSSSTKLVTILSISFFISIFPVGLSAWLQTFIKLHAGPTQIIVAINRIFSVAFIINTTLNCVFCGIMSSPYRHAAKELLRCKKRKQFNRVSTVASIV